MADLIYLDWIGSKLDGWIDGRMDRRLNLDVLIIIVGGLLWVVGWVSVKE